jgi:phenylalanyl-tRNA synthetase alpha chain
MDLKRSIESVKKSFLADVEKFPTDPQEQELLRVRYFGRKGEIASLFQQLKDADPSDRPKFGQQLNSLRDELSNAFKEISGADDIDDQADEDQRIDYSLPGFNFSTGSIHPLHQILKEIKDIFISIGFSVAYGPEIDDDYHNFQALNIPKHHPARDMQDTFFVDDNTVLRTHTSNVQIHLMENQNPPLRYIVPGRVYRNEAISFKSYCLFHQVEGLYVDKNVSFPDLKGTLELFVKRCFGDDVKMRFRPSFFPFTEPSAEMDIWSESRGEWLKEKK